MGERVGNRRGNRRGNRPGNRPGNKPEPKILFQQYFKSAGRGARTFASQVKETSGGDHFLVITEGRRDEESDEVKKSFVMLFSEDFPAFFRLLHETAQFIKDHPVPPEVKQRRQRYRDGIAGKRDGTRVGAIPAAAAGDAKRSPEPAGPRQREARRANTSN